jgi:hypothetical protein
MHWARFTDYRGIPLGKALQVSNNKEGFENILTRIKGVGKQNDLSTALKNDYFYFSTKLRKVKKLLKILRG